MTTEMIIWNAVLSFVSAMLLWLVKDKSDKLERLDILLNKTREEHARDYVTKADVHNDINRVLSRLDKLDEKLETFMREQRHAVK
jgi:archaellum component FlaC